jgi:hypothetical protein
MYETEHFDGHLHRTSHDHVTFSTSG